MMHLGQLSLLGAHQPGLLAPPGLGHMMQLPQGAMPNQAGQLTQQLGMLPAAGAAGPIGGLAYPMGYASLGMGMGHAGQLQGPGMPHGQLQQQ